MYYIQYERPICMGFKTRAVGESLYIPYRSDANIVYYLSNPTMYKWMFYYNLDDRKQFGRENPS